MTIGLYRVDDRLVHGQVVIGWGKHLDVGFIVLVDDAIAASAWERELYRMGVPEEIRLEFVTVQETGSRAAAWRADDRVGMLLTADIPTMVGVCRAAPPVPRVNLGGIHHRPGRSERLPYVYLTDEEFQALTALQAGGVEVTAQDLPTTAPVSLEQLR